VATGGAAQGREWRGGGRRRRANGDNGAARRPGRRGAGQGIPIPGDGLGNELHVGRQSGMQERKRGSGPEGENWPKRFREKTLSYFQNLFINFKLI
jgi:hypothetical protein